MMGMTDSVYAPKGEVILSIQVSECSHRVLRISPIYIKVGIPNSVCGCIPLLFWGHCDLDLWPQFKNNRFRSISPIKFDAGISNFVCGFILVL